MIKQRGRTGSPAMAFEYFLVKVSPKALQYVITLVNNLRYLKEYLYTCWSMCKKYCILRENDRYR